MLLGLLQLLGDESDESEWISDEEKRKKVNGKKWNEEKEKEKEEREVRHWSK